MRLTIFGDPLSKARPRSTVRKGKIWQYDPLSAKKKEACQVLRMQMKLNGFEPILSGPIEISLTYHMPIAKSSPEREKNAKSWGLPHDHKSDLDNLIKFTCDVGNQILWHDDAQIAKITATKSFSVSPCTEITVIPIKNGMDENCKKIIENFSIKEFAEMRNLMAWICLMTESFQYVGRDGNITELNNCHKQLSELAQKFGPKLRKLSKG